MKTTLTIACGASLFLLSFAVPADQVRFGVKEKAKLSKVFEDEAKFHSTSISVEIDGKDIEGAMDGLKVSIEESSRIEVSDVYGAPKEGKPSTVKRSFDKLTGKSTQNVELPPQANHEPIEESKERSSELEGKTVVFTLGDEGEYKAAFEDEKGDAALLEGLTEDMDMRGLLPDGDVEADKSWDIGAKVFYSVVGTPGGDLKLKSEDDKDDSTKFDEELRNNVEGSGKGTYKGTRDVDGHKCAVIALHAEFKTNGEREESDEEGPGGTMAMEISYTIEGELLWNLEAGHFQSCKMDSEIGLKVTNSMSMEHGGESHTQKRVTEFEGEGHFKASLGE
ncbi:MAG: hypothetical protein IPJ19_08695 [Planctomycetes bacterium]|nr:hypothetical protein [Planctomycetota bacterium]